MTNIESKIIRNYNDITDWDKHKGKQTLRDTFNHFFSGICSKFEEEGIYISYTKDEGMIDDSLKLNDDKTQIYETATLEFKRTENSESIMFNVIHEIKDGKDTFNVYSPFFFFEEEEGLKNHEINQLLASLLKRYFELLLEADLKRPEDIEFSYIFPDLEGLETSIEAIQATMDGYLTYVDIRDYKEEIKVHSRYGFHDKIVCVYIAKTAASIDKLENIKNYFLNIEAYLKSWKPVDEHMMVDYGYSRHLYRTDEGAEWFIISIRKGNWFSLELSFGQTGVSWTELNNKSLKGDLKWESFLTEETFTQTMNDLLLELELYELVNRAK